MQHHRGWFIRVCAAGLGIAFLALSLAQQNVPEPRSIAAPEPGAFGSALAAGDFDGDGQVDLAAAGANRVYVLSGGTFRLLQTLQAPEGLEGLGRALATGDFNGDGRMDLAATAQSVQGEVLVYLQEPSGLFREPQRRSHPLPPDEATPLRPLAAADFNGDTFDDLAIGVSNADVMEAGNPNAIDRAGVVLVYAGGALGLNFEFQVVISPQTEILARFGGALAAGDVTGDGIADLVVGARGAGALSRFKFQSGSLFVLLGQPGTSLFATFPPPAILVAADQALAALGTAVAVTDIDGDARADVATSVPGGQVAGQSAAGAVLVYTRLGTGESRQFGPLIGPAPRQDGHFGCRLWAGDVDGDGLGDVVALDAKVCDDAVAGTSQVVVYFGASGGLAPSPLSIPDPTPADPDDTFVPLGADVDGDGVPELLLGAPGASGGAGAVLVYKLAEAR